ncbi:sensor histidine kinase [Halorientalis regularis]|uniref:histidine kinase n=1 Tax=Halorientalis regularis TaxID=660518 RepID=A0A1G7FBS0_9EURY|nr:histidine kinase N-terminal 7TM domain-containing protein [Halorientalis regularis]SDE73306.1 PAS domain-containing protein [Halorientalis regularis]
MAVSHVSFVLIWGTITAAAALTLLAWRQRPKPGATPFAAMMGAGTWWVVTSAIGLFTLDSSRRILLHSLEWFGPAVLPPAWLVFALEYTSREEYVSRRTLAALGVVPLVTLFLLATNDAHHLLYTDRAVRRYGDIALVEARRGPWFWVFITYAYALLAAGTFHVIQLAVSSRSLYRGQAAALLVTVLAPWVGNLTYATDYLPVVLLTGTDLSLTNFDPTPFMFVISGAAGLAALSQFRFLDAVPVSSRVARDSVVESMDDGVIVVDDDDTVIDCNPRAADILDCERDAAVERPVSALLPTYSELDEGDTETIEIERQDGVRYYELSETDLGSTVDGTAGQIVSIHDVTDRRNRVQQLDVLNRVLRHNLRNEMNVIYGYADRLDDGEAVDRIQEKAMRMVTLGDKAREIDRILDDEGDSDPITVSQVLDLEVERARETYPDVTVESSAPDGDATCDRPLGAVLRNLLENAAEHNDCDDPRVRVDARIDGDEAIIEVVDNGPGIPTEERSVLRTKEETPLQHSSGLGLWLVSWGIERLGGTVTIVESDVSGTTIRLEVPVIEESEPARSE